MANLDETEDDVSIPRHLDGQTGRVRSLALVLSKGGHPRDFPLDDRRVVIGRSPGPYGIEIADARASREHAEIVFDPERISYRDILEFFFQIHDPTTKDRQGNDVGLSYRPEIFYTSDEQRQVAEDTIADVEASGLWPGKVVTEISEAVPFWEAEPEHQDYLQRIPNGYTCHFPRPGWKLPHRETAA